MILSVLKILKYQYFLLKRRVLPLVAQQRFLVVSSFHSWQNACVSLLSCDWGDYTAVVLDICAFELRRVTKWCGRALFVLSLAVGGISTCVCIRVTDAASINHKQFQENILKTYCFLGDLLHLQHHTSDPAAYRIWLSAIRAEYLNMVTT